MRTILFWLLPLYNLFAAVTLLRRVAFSSSEDVATAPTPNPALKVLAWTLTVAALAGVVMARDPRFIALPYVLFAINVLVTWRLGVRERADRGRTPRTDVA